eukprot:1192171-Prorocentrum_minimum.AAC.2
MLALTDVLEKEGFPCTAFCMLGLRCTPVASSLPAPSRDLFATLDDYFASQRIGAQEIFRVRALPLEGAATRFVRVGRLNDICANTQSCTIMRPTLTWCILWGIAYSGVRSRAHWRDLTEPSDQPDSAPHA